MTGECFMALFYPHDMVASRLVPNVRGGCQSCRAAVVAFHGEFWKKPGIAGLHVAPILLQCGAPKIAKLVYNSNNYGLWYL